MRSNRLWLGTAVLGVNIMPRFHEVRVTIEGDHIEYQFYRRVKGGRVPLGKVEGLLSEKAQLRLDVQEAHDRLLDRIPALEM